ncbi:MAG TPA: hypothetical protein VNO52_02875, partial [Methylomirabilota bacterium]|nr:hypothetical protein [Methylomirabilota bacterium]
MRYMRSVFVPVSRWILSSLCAVLTAPALEAAEFTSVDVGTPSPAGAVSAAGNGYDVIVGGTDIGGTNDQFSFTYQMVTGDFDLQLRVDGVTLADPWSKAGMMARESLAPGSRYAAALATPGSAGAFFSARTNTNAREITGGGFPGTYPNLWLRLKRVGDVLTAYAGVDGHNWA